MAETMTIESHSVSVKIDPDRLGDPRFTYCLSRVSDETVADDRKLVFFGRMLSVMLGEDGAYEAMCALADGGSVSADTFNEFFMDVLQQARAKNS